MILYLSRSESANLLDIAAQENNLHVRKITGNFILSEFMIMEVRKFASCRFFCVERLAISETDTEFLEAVQSFQTMYSARVIVIHESISGLDDLSRSLVKIGVTDIVTASIMEEKLAQIAECLSFDGLLKHKPQAVNAQEYDEVDEEEPFVKIYDTPFKLPAPINTAPKDPLAQSIIEKDMEDEHYRFDCVNITIGIIGASRRVGTTTFALGLTNFIKNHGGTACYVALNTHNHLENIATAYNFDTEEDYFTHDTIDFYEGMLPKYDYNFIIMDYGDVKREATRKYKESNVHLLCGASNTPHEIAEFAQALKQVKSTKPTVLTYAPNPMYAPQFSSSVTQTPTIINPAINMLDFKSNGVTYKNIIKPYIVETSKRL
ncbi:MAG: hypothetical protein FWC16_09520 [Defluviitaleaceae bacterium]|nr:hypothetical protein [Defluviitaleaceae bacterium]MCL2275151.1 hypothetical protein [Defluviitaleaceae bacterium]